MWNLEKGSIYVDNCGKTIDNTCKRGRLGQLGIPALSRIIIERCTNFFDDESQFTK
jgi:hypothetical protein